MKVRILANDIGWHSLDSKVRKVEALLDRRYSHIYGKVEITVEAVHLDPIILSADQRLLEDFFRMLVNGKPDGYDAECLLIDRKDWKGQADLGGQYMRVKPDLGFYVICGEEEKVLREYGKVPAFEDFLEHEMAHAVYQDMDQPFKWEIVDRIWIPGYDNVHYWLYQKGDKESMYEEINSVWSSIGPDARSIFSAVREQALAAIKKGAAMPASPDYAKPRSFLPLPRRVSDILIARAKTELGRTLRVIEPEFRSYADQQAEWSKGRDASGNVIDDSKVVTNARPGQSMHNFGVAFDVVDRFREYTLTNAEWEAIGRIGESLGLEWGGRWGSPFKPDRPHFQLMLGHSESDFRNGDVDYSRFA